MSKPNPLGCPHTVRLNLQTGEGEIYDGRSRGDHHFACLVCGFSIDGLGMALEKLAAIDPEATAIGAIAGLRFRRKERSGKKGPALAPDEDWRADAKSPEELYDASFRAVPVAGTNSRAASLAQWAEADRRRGRPPEPA